MLLRLLLPLLTALALVPGADASPADALRSGQLLRMHVIAQDDTAAMQALKLPIRDAVRSTYAALAPSDAPMLPTAASLLPQLTRSARDAARRSGFSGDVTVTLGPERFNARTLDGIEVPAGVYPALVVRLGRAQGHNWWGLLDPDTALHAAAIGPDDEPVMADWSLQGVWLALRRWFGGLYAA